MRQSQLFPKTAKNPPKDAVAVNHKYLVQAGFIDQLMSGSWTLLPLGFRVISKINEIIREEINIIGGQELLMPLMHPKEIWNETGRWESAKEVMYQFKDSREKEFALSFTHEEIVMDLIRKHVQSYHDLPIKLYHFSTKFRNEPRATGGILRGREFMMNDLYSAHLNEEDLMEYYEKVKQSYDKIFNRIGLETYITEASGGVFTHKRTHEFQVLAEAGEDTVYYCKKCRYGYNKEIFEGKKGDSCLHCGQGTIMEGKSIEAGNIFPLGTMYAEKMNVFVTDKDGRQKVVWLGSYGIGPTRIMGVTVEVFHDNKGILWPESVAPFKIHLLNLPGGRGEEIYRTFQDNHLEVLFDDRQDISAGEKFAEADLIGIPLRVVTSQKTGERIEIKRRAETETKIASVQEFLQSQNINPSAPLILNRFN